MNLGCLKIYPFLLTEIKYKKKYTKKMSDKQIVLIDTKNRNSYSNSLSTDNCLIYMSNKIKYSKYVKLLWANIPNTLYNINSSNNKQHIVVTTSNNSFNLDTIITFTPGYYSASQIASTLKTKLMQILSPSFLTDVTVTYDTVVNKIYIDFYKIWYQTVMNEENFQNYLLGGLE